MTHGLQWREDERFGDGVPSTVEQAQNDVKIYASGKLLPLKAEPSYWVECDSWGAPKALSEVIMHEMQSRGLKIAQSREKQLC